MKALHVTGITLLIALVYISTAQIPDPKWTKVTGIKACDFFTDVIEDSTEGFTVAGAKKGKGSSFDFWIIRYSANGVRLDLSQRLPVARLSDVPPELIAVMEAHFAGLDFSSLKSPEPDVNDEKSGAPEKSQSEQMR